MLALHQLAHEMAQVPTTPGQRYLAAGIGVLIVLVTGLFVQLMKLFKKKTQLKKGAKPAEKH